MGQALYRKYRSRSLDELVGQEHITRTLARALKAGRVNHAYLFTGPRGVGKTSVARILAHEINGLAYSDTPNLDIIEIDAASNRRIDDIRDLREKVYITPVAASYKVYIVDEVHMLTGESFNALLKTLEEPPAHVVFILATTEAHKLPATIVSRTQRFAFRPVTPQKVVTHLRTIADAEKISIQPQALERIAEHGEGSFRDSISLLDQLAHVSDGEITADDVTSTLGLAPQTQLDALVDAIVANDQPAAAALLHDLHNQGTSPGVLVNQLSRALVAAANEHPRLFEVVDRLLEAPRAYNPELKLLTVVMLATAPATAHEPKHMPARVASPMTTIARAQITTPEMHTAGIPPAEAPVSVPSDTSLPLTTLEPSQWQAVLTALKKTNPPLYSVAKHAQPSFNADDQELRLVFKYQLHRKKLDDSKARAALVSCMTATLGSAPTIKTAVDTAVSAGTAETPVDPVAASIAAIMGGGEIIDAPHTS